MYMILKTVALKFKDKKVKNHIEFTITVKIEDELASSNDYASNILRASLSFVPKYGWTIESLSHGANSLGYPSVSHGLFPRGGIELIDWFLEDSRKKMVDDLFDKMDGLKVHQKIRLACITRLNYTKPYVKKWSEALAVMAQPYNVQTSIEHLAKLVDDMWYLAGDKSADVKLYMMQDTSPDYTGTFQFLDRRLQDIATFGQIVGEMDTFAGFVSKSLVGILASESVDSDKNAMSFKNNCNFHNSK
ncbi:2277_t:CDS:2 [Cetraspora pellucida]|uniref:Ubiquinone biosynthesis protein n=1 Tax=Cetraspora pellucida TaxID=1433469 RepID=A0A9N9HIW0_9GLOM|nr:2277_t:CDS:2 [Cetraspora pellucida]